MGYFPVRIPIKDGVSVFKVSVPLLSPLYHQKTALSTTSSLPATVTTTTLVTSRLSASLASTTSTRGCFLYNEEVCDYM